MASVSAVLLSFPVMVAVTVPPISTVADEREAVGAGATGSSATVMVMVAAAAAPPMPSKRLKSKLALPTAVGLNEAVLPVTEAVPFTKLLTS